MKQKCYFHDQLINRNLLELLIPTDPMTYEEIRELLIEKAKFEAKIKSFAKKDGTPVTDFQVVIKNSL